MILLRHGQSQFNVHYGATRVDPGIEDPALTSHGERQAAEAGDRLEALEVRRIVASPYRRTLHTAHIIAEARGLPVSVEPLIREHAVFTCDIGTPTSELRRRWPGIDFADLPEIWWPRLGESEAEVRVRCEHFRRTAAMSTDWPHLLVVTHWGFIRGLTGEELANGAMLRFDPVSADTSVVVGQVRAC
jgi:broad specificity phosphatase PhoE